MTTKRSERSSNDRADTVMTALLIISGIATITFIILNTPDDSDRIIVALSMLPSIVCIWMGIRSDRNRRRR